MVLGTVETLSSRFLLRPFLPVLKIFFSDIAGTVESFFNQPANLLELIYRFRFVHAFKCTPIWATRKVDGGVAALPLLPGRRLQGGVSHGLRAVSGIVGGSRGAVAPHIAKFQYDENWRDLISFHEYFHGDTGAGVGASHQRGWTALVAKLMQHNGEKKSQLADAVTAVAAD
jgi:hypothetical protein